ncbi:MAG: DUF2341 domain-containing protein, partial [Chitinispirillaceae bacterium]|nr:DUF2341 domain-containing protein [Chitinispirillaceae bacterium]
GTYNLQAVHLSARTRLLITAVTVGGDTTWVATDTLRVPGIVKVYLPDGLDPGNCLVYVPGTTIAASSVPTTRYVVIDSVPAGKIPSLCLVTKDNPAPVAIRYNLAVASADTTWVRNPSWQHARALILNTSVTGADIAADVENFPVLIRLTSGKFDFSQAKSNGADLRFTKPDNTTLPHEIERWDPVAGHAEVWVKVDTVRGNDGGQSILMYWGNPDAADGSNSTAVFDTADGFTGVWHLGGTRDSIYDATGNAFDGKNVGAVAAGGVIGGAAQFTSENHIKIPGLLNRPSNVTLSAWVRSDTAVKGDIVSIGDAVLIRFDDIMGFGTGGFYHNNPVVNDTMYARVVSGQYLAKTGWHFLTFSIDAATQVQAFYIDGVSCGATLDANPINYAGLGSDTYIGMHGNGKTAFNFTGRIDEVRVNNKAVTSDWIKLCFMNQRSDDLLVYFK